MSKKFKKEDIEKGIKNLVKVVNRQKIEIAELKKQLIYYDSDYVCDAWRKMNVTDVEASTVIAIFTKHIKLARESYGNSN